MAQKSLTFVLDTNLGLPVTETPWKGLFQEADIHIEETRDMVLVDRLLANDGPDLAYVPGADFCVMLVKGNQHYRGLAIGTSKFTGKPAQRTLLVVRKDDPATSLDDLEGSDYGWMNRSCSSSYFPPAILLQQQGKKIENFLKGRIVGGWQERVDAVVAKTIRSTMILEDVWKMTPSNTEVAKIIGEYVPCVPSIVIARTDLDPAIVQTLQDHLLRYIPDWSTSVYGAFRPFLYADVQTFCHQLGALPANEL